MASSSMRRTVSAGSKRWRVMTAEPATMGRKAKAHWAEW